MGNKFNDFVDFKEESFDDLAGILEQEGVTIHLYRRSAVAGDAFTQELSVPTFVGKFSAKLSEETSLIGGGTDKHTPKTVINGWTTYRDVRLGDIWRFDSKDHRVINIDKGVISGSQVTIERLENAG